MLHPPAFISCFYDFTTMSEPIQHGRGHFLIPEDLGPLPKGQIRGKELKLGCFAMTEPGGSHGGAGCGGWRV